jgi:hypothetical protein
MQLDLCFNGGHGEISSSWRVGNLRHSQNTDMMMAKVWNWMTDMISATGAKKMSVSELKNRIGSGLPTLILDVRYCFNNTNSFIYRTKRRLMDRTPEEQETSCIPQSVLIHPGEDICQRQEFKSFVDKYLRVGTLFGNRFPRRID